MLVLILPADLFVKEEYHFLNVSGIGMFTVYDPFDCALECLSNPSCLSLNMAASKGADGKFWCELLTSDKYINPCEYKDFTSLFLEGGFNLSMVGR